MTSEGLGGIFIVDFAEMCAETFLHMLMGAQAEDLACADPGARTPMDVSRNSNRFCLTWFVYLMATYGCEFKQKFNNKYLWIAIDTIGVSSHLVSSHLLSHSSKLPTSSLSVLSSHICFTTPTNYSLVLIF